MIRFGFYIAILEIIRQILAQIAYYRKSYKLLYGAFVIQALNVTFMIVDFFLAQMWRWDVPGKVCSGDYLDSLQNAPPEYLIEEGLFLKTIIIAVYTILGLGCISVCVIALCLS